MDKAAEKKAGKKEKEVARKEKAPAAAAKTPAKKGAPKAAAQVEETGPASTKRKAAAKESPRKVRVLWCIRNLYTPTHASRFRVLRSRCESVVVQQ